MNQQRLLELLALTSHVDEALKDPEIAEALRHLESDPILKQKWESQQQWDRQIRKSLQNQPIPSDLQSKILKSKRAPQKDFVEESKIVFFPFWNQITWALAAMIVLFVGIWSSFSDSSMRDFVHFESQAVDYTQSIFRLSKKSPDLDEIRSWLAQQGTPHIFKIPFQLSDLTGIGCKQVKFAGITSSMICFQINGKHQEVHLFVMNKEQIQRLPSYGVPEFRAKKGNAIASWTDDEYAYVLTGNVSLDEMKKLF